MNTTSPTSYVPITAAILILAVVLFVIDLRAWGQPQTIVVQPTPTPMVIVIATPAATMDDQLAGLRDLVANQASGGLPSLDQFRASLSGASVEQPIPTPATDSPIAESLRIRQSLQFVAPVARNNPQGVPVYYDAGITAEGQTVVLTPVGAVYCGDTGWAYGSLAPWEQDHVIEICGMIQG